MPGLMPKWAPMSWMRQASAGGRLRWVAGLMARILPPTAPVGVGSTSLEQGVLAVVQDAREDQVFLSPEPVHLDPGVGVAA